jgi:hypothetical protein
MYNSQFGTSLAILHSITSKGNSMNGLIIIMLFAALPLFLLIENIALSEAFKNRHARHAPL